MPGFNDQDPSGQLPIDDPSTMYNLTALMAERFDNLESLQLEARVLDRLVRLGINLTEDGKCDWQQISIPRSSAVGSKVDSLQMLTGRTAPLNGDAATSDPSIWGMVITFKEVSDHFLLDPDTGTVLPVNTRGQLVIRNQNDEPRVVRDASSPPVLYGMSMGNIAIQYNAGDIYGQNVSVHAKAMAEGMYGPEQEKIDRFLMATLPFLVQEPNRGRPGVIPSVITVPDFEPISVGV